MSDYKFAIPSKERNIGSAKPPSYIEGGFTIQEVDRENNTVSLTINGCDVTLICSKDNNPKPYEQIKTILLGTVVSSLVK